MTGETIKNAFFLFGILTMLNTIVFVISAVNREGMTHKTFLVLVSGILLSLISLAMFYYWSKENNKEQP